MASRHPHCCGALLLILLTFLFLAPYAVLARDIHVTVEPVETLNEAFRGSAEWRGSDCAYSFPIGENKSLWLFGDTMIHQQNSHDVMINNTAAWLDQSGPGELSMQFFWKIKDGQPASILKPEEGDEWYWPGDGIVSDGKIWLFVKRVRRTKKPGPEEFQFDWFADDLLCLEPADGDPTQWTSKTFSLPEQHGKTLFGTACVSDNQYMYVYCSWAKLASGLDAHPAIVARISKASLPYSSSTDWQYWSKTKKAWVADQNDATILFLDAAPEMTVSYLPSLRKYVAVYMPTLSDKILMRIAPKPEGPFSDPILLYRTPESQIKLDGKTVGVYSAKAHPELSPSNSHELIITYCSNPGGMNEHGMRPDLYFPHALKVRFYDTMPIRM
jgi:hypothetical protein